MKLKKEIVGFLLGLTIVNVNVFAKSVSEVSLPPIRIENNIQKGEELLKDLLNCDGCSKIDNVNISKYDKKTNEITLELNVIASQTTMANLYLPDNVVWTKALINNYENSVLKNNGDMLLSAVPRGKSKLVFTGSLISNKLQFSENLGFVDSSVEGVKVNKSSDGYIVDFGDYQNNTESENKNNKYNFTLNSEPIYFVERVLVPGKEWSLTTRVSRLYGNDKNIVKTTDDISVPLLFGEKIISNSNLKIEDNKVNLNISDNVVEWNSLLNEGNLLELNPIGSNVFQSIRIDDKNSNWIFEATGSGLKSSQKQSNSKGTLYSLMPEENLNLNFILPVMKQGDLTVVGSVLLTQNWNANKIENKWNISVFSSVGGSYVINRKDDTSLIKNIKLNENTISVPAESKEIPLFLNVGQNVIEIDTKSSENIKIKQSTPVWDFNAKTYNYKVRINKNSYNELQTSNKSRWVLWAGGDMLKPSVLLWGYLFVIIGISFILKQATPLINGFQWALILFGFSTMPLYITFIFIIVMLLFNYMYSHRKGDGNKKSDIPLITVFVILILMLITTATKGLIDGPESFIVSIDNRYGELYWLVDEYVKNVAYVISLPDYVYTCFMFLWSIFIAFMIVKMIGNVIHMLKKT